MENSSIQNGLINYEDKSFIWNKNTENELSQVPAYGSGKVRLNIRIKNKASNGSILRFIVLEKEIEIQKIMFQIYKIYQ